MSVPATPAPPALVPLPKAPDVFGLSRSAIYRAAASGKITLRKLGKSTLVDTASALAFIAALPAATIRPEAGRGASPEDGRRQRPKDDRRAPVA